MQNQTNYQHLFHDAAVSMMPFVALACFGGMCVWISSIPVVSKYGSSAATVLMEDAVFARFSAVFNNDCIIVIIYSF